MKIVAVHATPYSVPVDVPLLDHKFHMPFVLVRVSTDAGIDGHGLCGGNNFVPSTARLIEDRMGPAIVGEDPRATERVWQLLYGRFNRRGMTGVWSSATSALDIALWDIKAKACGLPIAQLLGGARAAAPAYVTFGVSEYSREKLAEAAASLAQQGHRRLKMVVGGLKHMRAGTTGSAPSEISYATIREDARRVAAVREAVGEDVELMIDANCLMTGAQATTLCRLIEDFDVSWFEEPVLANDRLSLRDVREKTRIPIAAGQNLGHLWAHRELILEAAVDIVQPNACNVGGFTELARVAALARAFNLPIANGGGWPLHNLHAHAGLSNGGAVEFHWLAWKAGEIVFDNAPSPHDGSVSVPDRPGLGFEPHPDAELAEFRIAG